MEGSKPENYNNYLHFSLKFANKKKNYNHVHNIRDFLMVEQIFRSPHVKRSVIISNKLVYTSYLTSCRTTLGYWEKL